MKRKVINITFLIVTGWIMFLAVWGPEALCRYSDRTILNKIQVGTVEAEGGYRYTLGSKEKLYILSHSLNSQNVPESEQSAMTRSEPLDMEYQEGTYAFVINHRGPEEKEITDAEIYNTCNRELGVWKTLGILPVSFNTVVAADYEAVLYSAIDVLEPRNNVAVWKVGLLNSRINSDQANRLMDACIDADTGKIYELYARTEMAWEDIDPDEMIEKWGKYMGLDEPVPYEAENPLLETTPYYQKYAFSGTEEEKTIVTIGFYEGIKEIFIKISK